MNTIVGLMKKYEMTRKSLAERFGIPYRTIQNWSIEGDNHRECPQYVVKMIDECLSHDKKHQK